MSQVPYEHGLLVDGSLLVCVSRSCDVLRAGLQSCTVLSFSIRLSQVQQVMGSQLCSAMSYQSGVAKRVCGGDGLPATSERAVFTKRPRLSVPKSNFGECVMCYVDEKRRQTKAAKQVDPLGKMQLPSREARYLGPSTGPLTYSFPGGHRVWETAESKAILPATQNFGPLPWDFLFRGQHVRVYSWQTLI